MARPPRRRNDDRSNSGGDKFHPPRSRDGKPARPPMGAAKPRDGQPPRAPLGAPKPAAAPRPLDAKPEKRNRFTEQDVHRPERSPASKRRSRGHIPAELTDQNRGERLQKFLAKIGVASRRQCEAMIATGHVIVNGKPVTALPAWIDPQHDRIEVRGRLVNAPSNKPKAAVQKIYVMLNKPRAVVSTTFDPEQRMTVLDLAQLPPSLAKRVFPVGRLDADSSGLILLTNDGEMANRLTHPKYGITKQYLVSLRGHLTDEDVAHLKTGLYLAEPADRSKPHKGVDKKADKKAAESPAEDAGEARHQARVKKAQISGVQVLSRDSSRSGHERTRLIVTLKEGQNREIRRMMARLGLKVRRLQRMALGPLTIKGLGVGEWRLLTGQEVMKLRKITGLPRE